MSFLCGTAVRLIVGAEPMVMGSPSSPHPGSHNSSQYLPGFLLGDHTPGPSGPQTVCVNIYTPVLYHINAFISYNS